MKRALGAFGLAAALFTLAGCGGGKKVDAPPIEKETAADQILRISEVWTSALPTHGILSKPSPVSVFKNLETSQITLTRTGGTEIVVFEENLELRAGGSVSCSTRAEHSIEVRFGHRKGEPAVELVRPPLSVQRNCDAPHPEGMLQSPSRRALFILRSDQLVAVDPPLEKRNYLPRSM